MLGVPRTYINDNLFNNNNNNNKMDLKGKEHIRQKNY